MSYDTTDYGQLQSCLKCKRDLKKPNNKQTKNKPGPTSLFIQCMCHSGADLEGLQRFSCTPLTDHTMDAAAGFSFKDSKSSKNSLLPPALPSMLSSISPSPRLQPGRDYTTRAAHVARAHGPLMLHVWQTKGRTPLCCLH